VKNLYQNEDISDLIIGTSDETERPVCPTTNAPAIFPEIWPELYEKRRKESGEK